MIEHADHALHGGGDAEDVTGADAAVRVAEAFEGVALQRLAGCGLDGRLGQVIQYWRFGHAQHLLGDPVAGGDGFERIADDLAIAHHLAAFGDIHQRHLVALRDAFNSRQAIVELAARGNALVIDHHADVVARVQADVTGRILMGNQLHDACSCCAFRIPSQTQRPARPCEYGRRSSRSSRPPAGN